jgi:hypothetical protein
MGEKERGWEGAKSNNSEKDCSSINQSYSLFLQIETGNQSLNNL